MRLLPVNLRFSGLAAQLLYRERVGFALDGAFDRSVQIDRLLAPVRG